MIDPTIDAYNKFAQAYDDEAAPWWRDFPKSILQQFADALPGKKILDVGSGSGRDAELLRNLGLEVVCVDASSAMVARTRAMGFESHLADFSSLPFADVSFDGVWAYTSLVHVPSVEAAQAIRHIRSLLKPGGAFLIGAIEGDADGIIERKSMQGVKRYFKFYQPDELKRLITPLGFSLLYEEDYTPHNKTYLNQLYGAA